MKPKVQKIAVIPPMPRLLRVAAYARVSLDTKHMRHSLSAQVSYYNKYIGDHAGWIFAGVYADAAETGTRDDRPEFQRLIADCRDGKIDKVITKSISRFARNTVTLLETVRELKELGISVWFEEQNIDTLSGDGELMLSIIAGVAQEESRSVSENIKWRKRGDMKSGKTKPVKTYGYRTENGKLIIVPEQADVVRMMFDDYLSGMGQTAIANKLNKQNIPSPLGSTWSSGVVRRILMNPKMCGNLLHQRSYVTDYISKIQKANKGELPMYLVKDTHEGIVSLEIYNAVQAEMARRGSIGGLNESAGTVFRKKIICGGCGRNLCHSSNGRGVNKHRVWICGGRDKRTGANCTMLQIPEPTLMKVTAEALGIAEFDGDVFTERIEKIMALDGRQLTFVFKDGTEADIKWEKRKPIPYSSIDTEKRIGRNICYSIIGKGNGKIGERRRKKEAERNL